MKKFTVALLSFVVVFTCMVAHAETDYRAMKIINEWKVGENNADTPTGFRINGDLTITGTATLPNTTVSGTVAGDSVTVDGVAVFGYQSDTNEAIDVFIIVPAGIGQMLWGTASNEWYISHGTTTNDWDHLN